MLVVLTQLMVLSDATTLNVATPEIQTGLGMDNGAWGSLFTACRS